MEEIKKVLLLVLGCAVQVRLRQVGGEGCSCVWFVGMMPPLR